MDFDKRRLAATRLCMLWGESAIVHSQLRTHHPPRKQHLVLLFREARVIANDIGVSSWGHHYRAYNKMANRIANIALNTRASIQKAEANIVEATAFIDNIVNHSLETSQIEYRETQEPVMTPRT